MRHAAVVVVALSIAAAAQNPPAAPITTAGGPAQLDIRQAGEHSLRVTLKPIGFEADLPENPALADRAWGIYTQAWEASNTGLPLMRAMWLHYPADERARGLGTQYLWGRDLLVAPVFTPGAVSREVYLPEGRWYDWFTNESHAGGRTITRAVDLATMPIYIRAGAIVPLASVQYPRPALFPWRPANVIRVYRGADGQFTLYEDDGKSLDYLSGRGNWTRFTWDDNEQELTIEPAPPTGAINVTDAFTKYPRRFHVVVIPDGRTKDVTYDGTRMRERF